MTNHDAASTTTVISERDQRRILAAPAEAGLTLLPPDESPKT